MESFIKQWSSEATSDLWAHMYTLSSIQTLKLWIPVNVLFHEKKKKSTHSINIERHLPINTGRFTWISNHLFRVTFKCLRDWVKAFEGWRSALGGHTQREFHLVNWNLTGSFSLYKLFICIICPWIPNTKNQPYSLFDAV